MAEPMQVEVVSAARVVWSGQAEQIIARTSDGDLGILPGHAPVLAVLVPSGVEVYGTDGNREVVAVDGGFISVDHGHVSILSEYARLASEISVDEAKKELDHASKALESGDPDDPEARKEYSRAEAQLRAAHKFAGTSSHL